MSYNMYIDLMRECDQLRSRIREMERRDARRLKKRKPGRNSLKKDGWSNLDGQNELVIASYCKRVFYPHYKFLPGGWWIFSDDATLMCQCIKTVVELPFGAEWEYYWNKTVVPILNKKWIDFRNNDRTALHKPFKSESVV